MSKNLFTSDQMEHVAPLTEIGTSGSVPLDTLFPNINTRFKEPGALTVSGVTVTIGPTVVEIGPNGRTKSLPPIDGIDVGNISGSINLADGSATGDAESFDLPAIPDNYYIRIGFEVRSDAKIGAVIGDPGSTSELAVAPAFSDASSALGEILLKHNGTPGWGNFDPLTMADIKQFGSGSGTGGGSGAGAAKAPADGFQALISDDFKLRPADTFSRVNETLSTATHVASKKLYSIVCDKAKQATISGTTITLDAAPSFTVTPGCIIWINSTRKWARVTSGSGVVYTVDDAIGDVGSWQACMISQALWTKDLVNYGDAAEKTRLRDIFPDTNSSPSAHIRYTDSLVSLDGILDMTEVARVVTVLSNEGLQTDISSVPTSSQFGSIFARPTGNAQYLNYAMPANTNRQRCFVGFFANPDNSDVVNNANVLGYDLSLYEEEILQNGGFLKSAFCMSDGSGTPFYCLAPVETSGNTRVTLQWDYLLGINPGSPDGDIEVFVDGKKVPRFYTGIGAPLYWQEDLTNSILLNGDLTILSPAVTIHISKRQGVLPGSP